MEKVIHLTKDLVPQVLRHGYRGNKFKAVITGEVEIPMDAGLWSGGTRSTYSKVDLVTGNASPLSFESAGPFSAARPNGSITIRLESGFAIVKHSMFCGKDMGLTFYVHPDNASRLLPQEGDEEELPVIELLVLRSTSRFKSSYAGKDRYQMAKDESRWGGGPFPSREEWEVAKQSLIGKKLLNKAGAITPAGRNRL